MNRGRMSRTRVVIAAALAASVAVSAAAYWSATAGAGAGAAQSEPVLPLTLAPATAVAGLYPGATAGVRLTAHNPNDATVRVGALALDSDQGSGGFAVDPAHTACDVAVLTFATQDNGGSGWVVPGHDSVDITLDGALDMGLGAAQACQGATFTVYLEATP